MITYEDALSLHKKIHDSDPKAFPGSLALHKHIPSIRNVVSSMKLSSVCDYGCGKAYGWRDSHYMTKLGLKELFLYDPGVVKFSEYPSKKYDMVICTDVLEHIPEDSIDTVLSNIFSIAKKFVFLSISTVPARRMLDKENGINAHLCVQNKEWWIRKIDLANTNEILYNCVWSSD